MAQERSRPLPPPCAVASAPCHGEAHAGTSGEPLATCGRPRVSRTAPASQRLALQPRSHWRANGTWKHTTSPCLSEAYSNPYSDALKLPNARSIYHAPSTTAVGLLGITLRDPSGWIAMYDAGASCAEGAGCPGSTIHALPRAA